MLGLIACWSMIASMFLRVSTLLWKFSADKIFSRGPMLTAICKSFCTRVELCSNTKYSFNRFNTSVITVSYLAIDCKIVYHARLFNLSLLNIPYMPFFNVNLKPKKSAIRFFFLNIVLNQHKSETTEI